MADTVFLVGAPRSGTTWLQQMLGAHPAVVTPQETDLFDHYLAGWERLWREQLPDSEDEWRQRRHKGLPAVLTRAAFDEIVDGVVARVHDEVLALKPGATVVLEKVPGYSLHAPLVLRHLPDAAFIHLIRDGRDVVASMLGASRGWGSFWAPTSAAAAARSWREHVEGAREIRRLTDRYVEVRYEELRSSSGPRLLGELLRFCGAEAGDATSAALYHSFELDRTEASPASIVWGGEVQARLGNAPPEPQGFVGAGKSGAWQAALDVSQRLLVEREAGELLAALGYADDDWPGAKARERAAGAARRLVARELHRFRYRLAPRGRG